MVKNFKLTKEELSDKISLLGEECGTLKEIQIKLKEDLDIDVSQPTIGRWLKDVWGGDYDKKTKEMRERKSNNMRWKRDFENDRKHINPIFHKDYISRNDAIFFDEERKILRYMPQMTKWEKRQNRGRIIKLVYKEESSPLEAIRMQLIEKMNRDINEKNKKKKEVKINKEVKGIIKILLKDGMDIKNSVLFGRDLIFRRFDPAYRDNKGGRMLVLKGIRV